MAEDNVAKRYPYFKFYPNDWRTGVAGLSAAERGVYISLIAVMYDLDGPVRRDDARLSRECGIPKVGFVRALEALIALGKITVNGDQLFSERVKKELSERASRVFTAKENALSRWDISKQNQRPKNATASIPQCGTDAEPMLVQSTDISNTNVLDIDASKSKRSRAKPKTYISEDAQPTAKDRQTAEEFGLDDAEFRRQWAMFRNWHIENHKPRSNWNLAWRTWLLKSQEFTAKQRNGAANGQDWLAQQLIQMTLEDSQNEQHPDNQPKRISG